MEKSNKQQKSSIEEIRDRFDQDVERFSNLDTGQQTIIDAPLSLELCTSAAFYVNKDAGAMLDIGCGAGNYTLKMLEKIPDLDCTLIDLSMSMLTRAQERVSAVTKGQVKILQTDILQTELPNSEYDIVLAAAVLHHLRTDTDWEQVFRNIYQSLKPGGSFWISDLIEHEPAAINQLFEERYARHLDDLGGPEYRQHVLDYIAKEDTPRSVSFQLRLLTKVGFSYTEVLHKNACFAAFGAVK
ncbi:trans-aconitate 2-methyltransferase [Pedobacter sp. MC2016-24]|uniref:class I SAM-dependent methyltransferase n=1 Tax=Pedobacter sp. MC2016-24 TaxID=2780090 RepID=UPI0018814959|nr:class I SAM-dependent methyltransferase [Pedobacter sp. MC2016-24]MBE9598149.1 class I SAM-dependent methyltransferase [Pedobacter sp. MC2016-24]